MYHLPGSFFFVASMQVLLLLLLVLMVLYVQQRSITGRALGLLGIGGLAVKAISTSSHFAVDMTMPLMATSAVISYWIYAFSFSSKAKEYFGTWIKSGQ